MARRLISLILAYILIFWVSATFAADPGVLNVYVWFGEIPDSVIQQFEDETGIRVNYATYDSNETMYAKLKASGNSGYDIIEPSSYYIDRMRRENMLTALDKTKIPNFQNLDPQFINPIYDPGNTYSIPYTWGITGIFVNQRYFDPKNITSWLDLWDKKYRDQIMLLDDPREVFSMALIALGYSANDNNPEHIKQAYKKIRQLLPNIKLFNSNAMPSIPIDEDAVMGMAWNGDIYKTNLENPEVKFIFPNDGFVIWVDNLAIPKNAPHLRNAYKFLDFMLRAKTGAQATLNYGYAVTNLKSRELLPPQIRNNPIIFPDKKIMAKAQFQTDVGDQALKLYEKYWESLKLGG